MKNSMIMFLSRATRKVFLTKKCEGYRTKCERIYNKLRPFNKTIQEQFFEEEKDIPETSSSERFIQGILYYK
ncbi:MAG: hypothetical protein U5L72_13465 [Bacteroidales bacterium]|nr:hypothetical protein [Bacteroidales bacterium]